MLTLTLLRHAKAKPAGIDMQDFDRPLAKSGRTDALAIGKRMQDAGFGPELVLCAAAQRARETLSGVIPFLDGAVSVEIEPALYAIDAAGLSERLRALPPHAHSVLVIGHNPPIEDLARDLAADGAGDALARLHKKFPAGAAAALSFTTDSWPALSTKSGRLERFLTPGEGDGG